MKFGIFHIVQWHESRSPQEALGEAMEQIELAERLGIEEAWLGEHLGANGPDYLTLDQLVSQSFRVQLARAVPRRPSLSTVFTFAVQSLLTPKLL